MGEVKKRIVLGRGGAKQWKPLCANAVLSHALAEAGVKHDREKRFHPKRMWRFDVALSDVKIAVEVEGGVFGHGPTCRACGRRGVGAHSSIANVMRDMEKQNEAARLGWRVLRFLPSQVVNGEALRFIMEVLRG